MDGTVFMRWNTERLLLQVLIFLIKCSRQPKEKTHFPQVEYKCCTIEDVEFPEESFDVILSSLAFHYVADYEILVKKIQLIFSQNKICFYRKRLQVGMEIREPAQSTVEKLKKLIEEEFVGLVFLSAEDME